MLRQVALDLVQSPHTRRDCAKALDNLFHDSANRLLTRARRQE